MNPKIIDYLVSKKIINENKQSIYKYGLYVLEINLFTNIFALFIAILFNEWKFGVFFLLFFDFLRVTWGGYHTKHPVTCFFSFIIIYLTNLLIYKYINFEYMNYLAFCLISIVLATPALVTRNKNVQIKNEIKKKRICLLFCLTLLLRISWLTKILVLTLVANVSLHFIERFRVYLSKS